VSRIVLILFAFLLAMSVRADAGGDSYPHSYADIVAAAKSEKRLVIYSTVHANEAVNNLLSLFHARYPFIVVQDKDGDAALTYKSFVEELNSGHPSADFLWSSAMDLQEKLINDGYAQAYASPEMAYLPSWAHWQDLGYGTTLEPVAIVYNSRFLSAGQMPRTHAGLRDMLHSRPDKFHDRVALYDPQKSEVGMLFLSQDVRVTRDSWSLFDTFGELDARAYSTSSEILHHILAGDQWIGYDVIASYAVEMQKEHPELVIVYPSDYVLTMSRVGFITANAKHPNAAKLFLDFLLSREGQAALKNHGMGSVRADIGVPTGQARLDAVRTQAIRIGPGLLSDLDSLVRAQFLRRWQQTRSGPA
jgi:iron(III) transport system substrate-binding protein